MFNIKTIATASIVFLSLSYPTLAQDARCDYQPIATQITGQRDFNTYTASTTEMTFLQALPLSGKYKGRTVQSVGIDPSTCRTIATISMKQDPEMVGMWSLLPGNQQQGKFVATEEFGHPQNLAIQHDGTRSPYLWLPDNQGLGAKRFKLVTDPEGNLSVQNVQFFRLLNTPVASHTVTISADNQIVGIMGLISDKYPNKQTVKLFLMSDVLSNQDVSRLNPIGEFQLAPEQQPRGEYRQGLAIVGNTVFVLTGKPAINSPNRIVSYTLMGNKLQSEVLNAGVDFAAQNGEGIYNEPEGLEIISQNGRLALVVNLVSGDAGKKTNQLYKVPLYGSNGGSTAAPQTQRPQKRPLGLRTIPKQFQN